LAKTAQAWADELLHACGVVGIEHEDFNPYGENLAKNVGRNGWGQLYPANSIVGRWVEFEVGLPYPSNGHLTQVLWRASTYLGCGESAKEYRGGMCRVQVCRYGRWVWLLTMMIPRSWMIVSRQCLTFRVCTHSPQNAT
jgi:hypothetical protein